MIKTAKVCVLCGRTHKVGKEYQYLTSYDDTGMRYLAPVVQVEPVCLRCMLSQAWFTCIRIGRTLRIVAACRPCKVMLDKNIWLMAWEGSTARPR